MKPSEYDNLISSLSKLPRELKSYIEKRLELFTLETGERVSNIITHALFRISGVIFIALGLILVLFALSHFMSALLGSEALGFFVVAVPVIFFGTLFFFLRPKFLVSATRNKMMNQFMKDLPFSNKENKPVQSQEKPPKRKRE